MISKESFDSIKEQLKLMSDKQLDQLSFEVYVELDERYAALTGREEDEC